MATSDTSETESTIKKIAAIRAGNPGNLMARYFDSSYYRDLDDASRQRLMPLITTGIENPDSQMGAYAMRDGDYDKFAPFLEPMIRKYHDIPDEVPVSQPHDWNVDHSACDLTVIDPALADTSMRVRVARNITGHALPGALKRSERVELENLLIIAFGELISDPDFGGKYLSLTPDNIYEIGTVEFNQRVSNHQMFKDMSEDRYLSAAGISSDWPWGRGMYVSEDEGFLVWVGEEDQLRIMAMQRGGSLGGMFARLHAGLQKLESVLPPFAHSPTYGYLTSCPTNLGAGMRASLHIPLPKLTENGTNLEKIKAAAEKLSLAVRGAGGEHSAAGEGGLVDISPSARLGVSEVQIMHTLYEGAAALWALEKSMD